MLADGEPLRKIATQFGVSAPTIRNWAKHTGIEKNQPLTDEELDAAIEQWGDNHRKMEIRGEATERRKAHRAKTLVHKFGHTKETKEKNIATFSQLGDVKEFQAAIKEQAELNKDFMSGAMSPQDQAQGMVLSLLLPQLHEMVANMPPITNWADLERFSKMLRTWLGMDKDEANQGKGADLKILNARVEKDKIIDIGADGKPVKRRRKSVS